MTPLSELIRKETLDTLDPFMIKEPLFNNEVLESYSVSSRTFYEDFYLKFLLGNYRGEILATDVYTLVQNIVVEQMSEQYKNISLETIEEFKQKLNHTLKEENEHEEYFQSIIETVYNRKISQLQKLDINSSTPEQSNWKNWNDFTRLLIFIYMAEVYVFSAYYLFYEKTTNPAMKKVLHKLIRDESQHNVRVYNFFKEIKKTHNIDEKYFDYMVDSCAQFKYFGSVYAEQILSKNKNFKQDDNIYKNNWQKRYMEITLKKWDKLLTTLFPSKSINDLLLKVYPTGFVAS